MRHRYGVLLVTTPTGHWYWDELLWMLAFVENGKRKAKYEHNLTGRRNNFVGALRTIASIEDAARF